MKAVTWHGKRDMRVDNVPDPSIEEPTDVIVRITSSGICGSDLHPYEVLMPFMSAGDIMGHEPMGIVEEVGPGVTDLRPGDRVVIPFQIACESCFMCPQGLQTQCDATQIREHGMGAALFGYTKLYGQVLGGQAEYLPVPHGTTGRSRCRRGRQTTAFCTCPTCCQRLGRPSSTPGWAPATPSWCSAQDRSKTWPAGSLFTAGSARSPSTWSPSGSPGWPTPGPSPLTSTAS